MSAHLPESDFEPATDANSADAAARADKEARKVFDPGPDRTFRITFDIPEWVSREKVRVFQGALQEQGPYPNRLGALDQAAYRIRASLEVSPAEFRIYDAVLDVSKGDRRCSLLDMDKIAFLAGISDRSNAAKLVKSLEEKGAVVALRFTEGKIATASSRKVLVAPVITAEDRSGATVARIYAEMEEAKVARLSKLAEDARSRHRLKHPQSPSRGEEHHEKEEPSLVVRNTTRAASRGDGHHDNSGVSRGDGHHENGVASRGDPSISRGDEHHILNHKGNHKEKKGGADAPSLPLDADATANGVRYPNGKDHHRQPSSAGNGTAARRNGHDPAEAARKQSEMNLALGGQAAYAERNITIAPSGKLIIGEELRAELLQTYTGAEIDGAADTTPAACGQSPTKLALLNQLRRQCVYRKQDAAKIFKPKPTKPKPARY
jgi:hypothetical protein